MKKKDLSKTPDSERGNQVNDNDAEGYPLYPPSEDIYNRFKEEQDKIDMGIIDKIVAVT